MEHLYKSLEVVVVISKWKQRYRKWKIWKRYTWYGRFRQLLVLFGIEKNSYFDSFQI
jgi:hypothetical protein